MPNEPANQEEQTFMLSVNYRQLVGRLLYLLHTRPDIAFAVNQLARFVANPRHDHWRAALRVLRYISVAQSTSPSLTPAKITPAW